MTVVAVVPVSVQFAGKGVAVEARGVYKTLAEEDF
jgi:hypothetical protein